MKRPKYIFCATTECSGIPALGYIFGLTRNVVSGLMFGRLVDSHIMNAYNSGDIEAVYEEFVQNKGTVDEQLKDKTIDVCFDSSYMFLRSYAKVACEILGSEMAVVHLIRNPVVATLEMCELHYYFPKHSVALHLDYKKNIFKPDFTKYREFQDIFFTALWSWFEAYVRSKNLISKYRNMRHYVFFSHWLRKDLEVKSMLGSLGLMLPNRKMKSATSAFDILRLRNLGKPYMEKSKAVNMAMQFVNMFGDQFQLSKAECEQLINLED